MRNRDIIRMFVQSKSITSVSSVGVSGGSYPLPRLFMPSAGGHGDGQQTTSDQYAE
jgi:hypothetical protein